jgi:hypothetical protein
MNPDQDTARDTEAFFSVNALLLRNTSVVNMLDGCALSLPCHTPDELPVGLMVWHAAGRDDPVLNIGPSDRRITSNTIAINHQLDDWDSGVLTETLHEYCHCGSRHRRRDHRVRACRRRP